MDGQRKRGERGVCEELSFKMEWSRDDLLGKCQLSDRLKRSGALPCWSSGLDLALPTQGARVQSLVRQVKSHLPCSAVKNKMKRKRKKRRGKPCKYLVGECSVKCSQHARAKAMRWECAQLVRDTAVRSVGQKWRAWWSGGRG